MVARHRDVIVLHPPLNAGTDGILQFGKSVESRNQQILTFADVIGPYPIKCNPEDAKCLRETGYLDMLTLGICPTPIPAIHEINAPREVL